MSYRVAIVSEDPTNNGYILSPLIERVLAECGKPRANVHVISNPRTNGYEHAKRLMRSGLIQRYATVDLLLFLPDADGKHRQAEFDALEVFAGEAGTTLLCCAAHQEVETWLLAGHVARLAAPWQQVRSDVSVKENVFRPFLQAHGDPRRPGYGRKDLMLETLKNYAGLKLRCPELAQLEQRIREHLLSSQGQFNSLRNRRTRPD